jgi:competence ComEA-like helix-hairpin-helix protein
VGLYTRQQLVLLLLLLGAAVAGLGVVHWRAAHPAVVERLEQLDREILGSDDTRGDDRPPGRDDSPRARKTLDREARPPAPPRSKLRPTSSDESVAPLDLNRATLADLTRLPGVGPVLARRILETRDAAGRFVAVDDLTTVRGLGRMKLERLRPLVSVLE